DRAAARPGRARWIDRAGRPSAHGGAHAVADRSRPIDPGVRRGRRGRRRIRAGCLTPPRLGEAPAGDAGNSGLMPNTEGSVPDRALPGRLGDVRMDGELPRRQDLAAVFDELDYQLG